MKLKIGDTVRVREDLKEKAYKGVNVSKPMLKYVGKTTKIIEEVLNLI